jgi:hypothetical protein
LYYVIHTKLKLTLDVEFGKDIKFNAGNNVDNVVSFKLEPQFDGGDIEAVCVTDIEPADKVIQN